MGVTSLKTKRGAWVKPGRASSRSGWPGSYRDYTYMRGAPAPYPKTAQQKKIGAGGRCVAEKCTGKTGTEFKLCLLTCVKR